MIDFSGFKDYESTSRESFIQLWQHAHRIKGNIEVTFYAHDTDEQIELVAHDGEFEIYGFPPFDTGSNRYNFRLELKVQLGEDVFPFSFDFGIRGDKQAIEKHGISEINAVPFFRRIAESFPGAVLNDGGDHG